MTHNLGLKFISVLIAVSLWVVVFGSRTIEITKEVPFEVAMGANHILLEPVPEKIVFKIVGPKAFLRSLTGRLEDPIRANVQNLKAGIMTHKIYSDAIKLPPGVRVSSITPNSVQIKVEEQKQKWLGVNLETTGEVPGGLKLLRSEILPGQLRVRGPKDRLAGLNVISSQPIDLSTLRETTVVPLAFDFKALGIESDSVLPEVNFEVQGKGIAYRVRGVPIRLKSNSGAEVQEKEVSVVVRVSPSETVKLDGEQVVAEIDVRDHPAGEYQKWVKVRLPEKVQLLKVVPSIVRVSVKP